MISLAFFYLLVIAKHLVSNQNNEGRASMLRGFHFNKQGNFHSKYMLCHASTKQKKATFHLIQMPGYPGSYILPENKNILSLLTAQHSELPYPA